MAMDGMSGKFALDLQGLQRLRQTATRNPQEGVKEATKQFESVFLKMMLKSMREATPQSGLLDSQQTRFYTEMLDQQWAQHLSGQGFGLAEQLVQQLEGRGLVAGAERSGESLIAGIPRGTPRVLHGGLVGDANIQAGVADEDVQSSPTRFVEALALEPDDGAYAASATSATKPNVSTAIERPTHVGEFLAMLKAPAQAASRTTGVPAELILAQAALETGWGRHEIPTADGGNSHNLFGIKAGSQWQGDTTDITTTEYVDGRPAKVVDSFRVYDDFQAALTDYARLIGDNPRYAGVVTASNADDAARALQTSGYATDPAYADKLIAIMSKLDIGTATEAAQTRAGTTQPATNTQAKLDAYAIDRMPTRIF